MEKTFDIILKNRKILHDHLDEWLINLEKTKNSKKVRWSLDIDPQDMN